VTIGGHRLRLPIHGQIYSSTLIGIEVIYLGDICEIDIVDVEDIGESRESH
jgi:hypothetical protein